MFERIFRRTRRADRLLANRLYEQIVAAARQPVFFSDLGVPDTPLGRFEMLSIHMILFLRQVRNDKSLAPVAQQITDEFFLDLDDALRELGIGDIGVPKRMKKLARMFYGRAVAYGEAIDAGDDSALGEALARNIMPETTGWTGRDRLCAYVRDAASHLASIPHDEIARGVIEFLPAMPGSVDN